MGNYERNDIALTNIINRFIRIPVFLGTGLVNRITAISTSQIALNLQLG